MQSFYHPVSSRIKCDGLKETRSKNPVEVSRFTHSSFTQFIIFFRIEIIKFGFFVDESSNLFNKFLRKHWNNPVIVFPGSFENKKLLNKNTDLAKYL
jgi:hypothetical protein